jgi:hypothetical protein
MVGKNNGTGESSKSVSPQFSVHDVVTLLVAFEAQAVTVIPTP